MDKVSANQVESTRKNAARIQGEILRRLAEVTQARAAECIGVDASTVSRMKGELEDACLLLAALGLQIVDNDVVVISPEDLAALERLGYQYFKMKVEGRS